MKKTHILSQLPGFTIVSLLLFLVSGCSAQNQQTGVAEKADKSVYPKEFSIKVLEDGLNPDFGIRIIGALDGLRGSFSYVSIKNLKPQESMNLGDTDSILQILSLSDGQLPKAKNFALPAYDPKIIASLGWPKFRNLNKCFVRAAQMGSDSGKYRLYELNTEKKKGRLLEDDMYLPFRFQVSPDGDNYAYELADPHSMGFYRIVAADQTGQKKIVSEKQISSAFSWTFSNTLIYPDFAPKNDSKKNYGYPDIYENDLKGHVKLIKKGGYWPLMSPDRRNLASFVAYVAPQSKENDSSLSLFSDSVGRVALSVYDMKEKRDEFVTKIYESYPKLFWSSDGKELYVIENFYSFSRKTAICRISVYNTISKKYKTIRKLEQKGDSTSFGDGKFVPYFVPIQIANNTDLLLQVPISVSGKDNYNVVRINLKTGESHNIVAFTSPIDFYHVPLIDWINS